MDAFVNMLGEEETSWGLSHKGLLWHAGRHKTYIKPFRWSEPRFFSPFDQGCFSEMVDLKSSLVSFRENVATTIGIYFDGISGNLTFYKDGHNLGVAFTGLHEVLFIT